MTPQSVRRNKAYINMEERHLFHDRYKLVRLLGRGNFSEVWLADDVKTNTEVALKIYAPATGLDDDGLDIFAREFAIVVNANNKYLLKPLHYDTCDRKPYLVLPYCHNGSTQKRIGMMKEKDVWKFLHDVACGLNFLHEMKPPVIHQDIKPDNVMVGDGGDYMLTDFGISSHCKSALRRSVSEAFKSAGTTAYMAPERFGKNGNIPIMASDIYSLGATAFELLTGDTPFGNDGGLFQRKGAEIPELGDKYSADLKKVIRQCLEPEPWKRPTAAQLEEYAGHGMNGERFRMAGEKSFMQKFWPIIIVALIALCGGAYWAFDSQTKTIEQAEQQAITDYNDSIATIIGKRMKTASEMLGRGRRKSENYDKSLLTARQEYAAALSMMGELRGKDMPKEKALINKSIVEIDTLLRNAYEEMKAKAEFFADEPSIKAEFDQRAGNIAKTLNLK